MHAEDDGVRYLVAGLSSIVGFRRLCPVVPEIETT